MTLRGWLGVKRQIWSLSTRCRWYDWDRSGGRGKELSSMSQGFVVSVNQVSSQLWKPTWDGRGGGGGGVKLFKEFVTTKVRRTVYPFMRAGHTFIAYCMYGRSLVFNAQSTISVISGWNTIHLITSQSFHRSRHFTVVCLERFRGKWSRMNWKGRNE